MIKVIINADDFGYSKIFNEKILELLEKGFLKSTTVLVSRITPEQKNQIDRLTKLHETSKISIGLHTEFDLSKPFRTQIEQQYQSFISIFGFEPIHLDLHKLVHNEEAIKEVNRLAEEKKIPVRNMGVKANTKQTTYRAFSSKGWVMNLDDCIAFLQSAKEGSSCELITHPGEFDPESKSSLNKQREEDFKVIVKLQEFFKSNKNMKNISYAEL